MNVKAKGAFKWGNANSCASALEAYEEAGYGVLAKTDWKVAGAYAFIDAELELDVDMASWRDSFEELASSAQEGEVDLDPQEGGTFFRLVKTRGKKKVAIATEPTGFGVPHGVRLREWGAAVEKIQKAELKAKQKREAERAEAEKLAARLLVARHELGEYGQGLLAESDGTVTVLAAKGFHRIGPSGVVFSHALEDDLSCFARLDEETTIAWDVWKPTIVVIRPSGVKTFSVGARVIDVLPGKKGEILVHEATSLRRIEIETGRELGSVAFPEIEPEIERGESRRVAARKLHAVALPDGIAFAINGSDDCEIVCVDRELSETRRIEVPNRVPALAVSGGKLFALVNESYTKAKLVRVDQLDKTVLEIGYEGRSATPHEDGWTLCGGFQSVTNGTGYSHGWVARVADVMPDGGVVIASLQYTGGFHVVRNGSIEWRGEFPSGVTVQGLKAVGKELVGWSYGAALFRFRENAKPERLLGHSGPIQNVVALGATRFASLDEKGELRIWDLAL